ncbi:hypothetical protein AAC387_Pa08g1495 [Persea americana]
MPSASPTSACLFSPLPSQFDLLGAACPFASPAEYIVVQDKLLKYLDVAEMHLVKEVSLRSTLYFKVKTKESQC